MLLLLCCQWIPENASDSECTVARCTASAEREAALVKQGESTGDWNAAAGGCSSDAQAGGGGGRMGALHMHDATTSVSPSRMGPVQYGNPNRCDLVRRGVSLAWAFGFQSPSQAL